MPCGKMGLPLPGSELTSGEEERAGTPCGAVSNSYSVAVNSMLSQFK